MSVLIALLLQQVAPVTATVPEPNPELKAAHSCLVKHTDEWLAEHSSEPTEDDRWQWAVEISAKCSAQVRAAANSDGALDPRGSGIVHGITTEDMLLAEARYYVLRLVTEHFDARTGEAL
ncbi:MAG: hypothetical protein AAF697_04730 [Pseudomonadota bacterium]